MRKGLTTATFGLAIAFYLCSELLSLPSSLKEAQQQSMSGLPTITGSALRSNLYITAENGQILFHTPCYIANEACKWVNNNPGVQVSAKVINRDWPYLSWLASLEANNEFSVSVQSQERELSGHKRRTLLGLLGTLALSAFFFRSRQAESRSHT